MRGVETWDGLGRTVQNGSVSFEDYRAGAGRCRVFTEHFLFSYHSPVKDHSCTLYENKLLQGLLSSTIGKVTESQEARIYKVR